MQNPGSSDELFRGFFCSNPQNSGNCWGFSATPVLAADPSSGHAGFQVASSWVSPLTSDVPPEPLTWGLRFSFAHWEQEQWLSKYFKPILKDIIASVLDSKTESKATKQKVGH